MTLVQRKVLQWIATHGPMRILTGYKTVTLAKLKDKDELVIAGNVNLLCGLNANQLVDRDPDGAYRLSEKGSRLQIHFRYDPTTAPPARRNRWIGRMK